MRMIRPFCRGCRLYMWEYKGITICIAMAWLSICGLLFCSKLTCHVHPVFYMYRLSRLDVINDMLLLINHSNGFVLCHIYLKNERT